ncbi:hypothetical protein OUZ56_012033 [Daphnia magna]|uniref:Uncharacterized protein n=1 Tax=Daphnia magna TaxID=35525 RepID=A0ABQ9Z1X9_9CRUS|nr:hypothetical protein OUZ56_012033 [Daphnia magna]
MVFIDKGPPKVAATGLTSKENVPNNFAVPITPEEKSDRQETYVLKLNSARLFKEAVKCGKVTALALIELRKEFVKKPLNGPKIRLVNVHPLSPQNIADIVVTDRGKTIKGNAIVMPISDFELLLGNDFLQQCRATQIDFESEEPSFTRGKSLLGEINPLQAEE